MSDDIVKRLREYDFRNRAAGDWGPTDEAADEIERLRAYFSAHAATIQKQSDEIERLRAALEIYAEECHGACCIEGYRQGPGCGYAARAALSPPAQEQKS